MKNTTNVFLKGMTSDMHPLTTSQQEYTDALNATLVTFNGNEQMMQNDMGNTKIQDSKTGNIMGLREGFIPVGLKEHGGIMYIASVNKEGEGEIGTIPSPVIRYNKQKDYLCLANKDVLATPSHPSELCKLTDEKIYTGEKFAIALQMPKGDNDDTFPTTDVIYSGDKNNQSLVNPFTVSYPVYSQVDQAGLYKPELFVCTDDQIFDLTDQTETDGTFTHIIKNSGVEHGNSEKYWFAYIKTQNNNQPINLSGVQFDVDRMLTEETTDDNTSSRPFFYYPQLPPGYPAIRFSTENIESFSLAENQAQHQVYPLTKSHDPGNNQDIEYGAIFPYFEYTTNSAVHVDKMVIEVLNSSGEQQILYKDYNDWVNDIELTSTSFTINMSSSNYRRRWLDTSTNKFYIFRKDQDLINAATASDFNTNYEAPLFYMHIGTDLNQWYTLRVTYYSKEWENDPIGEYKLEFNQYVMDILHQFVDLKLEETDFKNQKYFPGQAETKQLYINDINPGVPAGTNNINGSIYQMYINPTNSYHNPDQDGSGLLDEWWVAFDVDLDNLFQSEQITHILKYIYGDDAINSQSFVIDTISDSTFPVLTSKLSFRTVSSNEDIIEEYLYGATADQIQNATGSITFKVFIRNGYQTKTIECVVQTSEYSNNPPSSSAISIFIESSYNEGYDTVVYGLNYKYIFEEILRGIIADYSDENRSFYNNNSLSISITPYKCSLRAARTGHYSNIEIDCENSKVYDTSNYQRKATIEFELENLSEGGGVYDKSNVSIYTTCTVNSTNEFIPNTLPKSNIGEYKVIPQFNLTGADKAQGETIYKKYGYTTADDSNDLIPVQCNIDTSKNYLNDLLETQTLFTLYNQSKSTLFPELSLYELTETNSGWSNSSLTETYRDVKTNYANILIPAGMYYFGISAVKITPQGQLITTDTNTSSDNTWFRLTFHDPINNKEILPYVYATVGSDFWSTSKRSGCLIYLPYDSQITYIHVSQSSTSRYNINEKLLIQDIGLYALNLEANEILSRRILSNADINNWMQTNKPGIKPNAIQAGQKQYANYFIAPQLCSTFIENGEYYGLEDRYTINNACYAYQQNYGNYNFDSLDNGTNYTTTSINLPGDKSQTKTYRTP